MNKEIFEDKVFLSMLVTTAVVCLALLLGVSLLFLYSKKLDRELLELSSDVKNKSELLPAYNNLVQGIKSKPIPSSLSNRRDVGSSVEEVANEFVNLAKKSNVKCKINMTRLKRSDQKSYLTIPLVLKGSFENCNRLVKEILRIDRFNRVERIRIQRAFKNIEFKVELTVDAS